jgi:hypothetical protein
MLRIHSLINSFIALKYWNNTHWMALYVSSLIPERFVCLCIHTFILTYMHTYAYIENWNCCVKQTALSTAALPRWSHSVVRRKAEIGRLGSNWAGQADNPLHSAIKTEEVTRKLLCLVKKWGHCPMACREDQYWMTTHRDINFGIAEGDFRYFEDREVQKTTA